MSYKSPVEQKQSGKNHARNTVRSHESKVHPAQIVGLNHTVLVNEHRTKKYNADIVRISYRRKESGEHNKGG